MKLLKYWNGRETTLTVRDRNGASTETYEGIVKVRETLGGEGGVVRNYTLCCENEGRDICLFPRGRNPRRTTRDKETGGLATHLAMFKNK